MRKIIAFVLTAVILLCLLAILFAVLTIIPPEIPLFTDYTGNTGLPE